jgi:hypothetical protein
MDWFVQIAQAAPVAHPDRASVLFADSPTIVRPLVRCSSPLARTAVQEIATLALFARSPTLQQYRR